MATKNTATKKTARAKKTAQPKPGAPARGPGMFDREQFFAGLAKVEPAVREDLKTTNIAILTRAIAAVLAATISAGPLREAFSSLLADIDAEPPSSIAKDALMTRLARFALDMTERDASVDALIEDDFIASAMRSESANV